jgi:AraC family transcriptional regulator
MHVEAMLRYLGSGIRRFGMYPVPAHQRVDWEFFAVVGGRCGSVLADTKTPVFRDRHLWIFPPETAHGWAAPRTARCRVAVFHFSHVPPLLERIARERGYIDRSLNAAQVRQVTEWERELRAPFQHATQKSQLIFDKVLLELSLLALEPLTFERFETQPNLALHKVETSLRWYSEHMSEQPKLEHVAQAVHISPSHLRRLFWQVRRENPLRAFTRLRLARAAELLAGSTEKIDAIASRCGFSSASDFCRVFKANHKISPDTWRREKLPAYVEPTA